MICVYSSTQLRMYIYIFMCICSHTRFVCTFTLNMKPVSRSKLADLRVFREWPRSAQSIVRVSVMLFSHVFPGSREIPPDSSHAVHIYSSWHVERESFGPFFRTVVSGCFWGFPFRTLIPYGPGKFMALFSDFYLFEWEIPRIYFPMIWGYFSNDFPIFPMI